MRKFIIVLSVLVLITMSISCGDKGVPSGDDPPFYTYQLEIIGGNDQTGSARSVLPDSLTVRVINNLGDAVVGDTVRFTQITAEDGAQFLPQNKWQTDEDGLASIRYRLDTLVGVDTIKVVSDRVGDSGAVYFGVTVTGGRAVHIEKVWPATGEVPTDTAGQPLAQPVTVLVSDRWGNPTNFGKVYFVTFNRCVVGTDSSALRPYETDSAFTVGDINGLAQAEWTLSVNPGPGYPAIHQLTAYVNVDDTLADTVEFLAWASNPGTLEYYYNIRRIFEDNCFQCHGPEADTSYRLDFYYQAFRNGNIIPGDTSCPLIANLDPFGNHYGNVNAVEEDKAIRWVMTDNTAPGSSGLYNYNDHVKSIIDNACITCHGAAPEGNYSMTGHLEIRGGGSDAIPNAIPGADSSLVVQKLQQRHNWTSLDPDSATAQARADSIILWIVDEFLREY